LTSCRRKRGKLPCYTSASKHRNSFSGGGKAVSGHKLRKKKRKKIEYDEKKRLDFTTPKKGKKKKGGAV